MTNSKKQNGFGLVEIIIVVLVIAIIVVLALPTIISSRRQVRFSGVQKQVTSALREARQEAMEQKTVVTFHYDDTNKSIILWGGGFGKQGDSRNRTIPVATEGAQPNDVVYGLPSGAPVSDLGDGTNITSLSSNAVDITFQSDGSVMDASNHAQNKALFFYCPQNPADTAFAVSVLGAGGRTKLWRYNRQANVYAE